MFLTAFFKVGTIVPNRQIRYHVVHIPYTYNIEKLTSQQAPTVCLCHIECLYCKISLFFSV